MNEVMPCHEFQQDLISENVFEVEGNIKNQLNLMILFFQNHEDHQSNATHLSQDYCNH